MKGDPHHSELDHHLARFLEGDAEPVELEALAAEVANSPDLAHNLAALLALDQWLRDYAIGSDDSFAAGVAGRLNEIHESDRDFVSGVEQRLPKPQKKPGAIRTPRFLPWTLAAAAMIFALAWPIWRQGPKPGTTNHGTPVVALLVNAFDAEFAEAGSPDAVSFGPGYYHLTKGAAQVRFQNGADVILESPVEFHIEDALHMTLVSGSVRALVPPTATGFTVQVPDARFEDLGTEFGASVDAAAQRSELHVFEGLVEVKPPDNDELLASVTYGKAVAVDRGVVSAIPTADPERFATSSSIALRRWEAQRASLCRDPNLVFYFAFEDDGNQLENSATFGSDVPGNIHRARWVTGRWPGKRALQFENPGDSVLIDIPGNHAAFTLSSWIKVDRYDHSLNALLNSADWSPGRHHWQFNRLGLTASGSFEGRDRTPTSIRVVPGQWTHVAAVVDGVQGKATYYTNGELAMTETMPPGTVFRLGTMHLGTWTSPNKDWPPAVRDFRGRVDELAMWRRALTQTEIQTLVREGSPLGLLQGAIAP